jgi:hypothetical protein
MNGEWACFLPFFIKCRFWQTTAAALKILFRPKKMAGTANGAMKIAESFSLPELSDDDEEDETLMFSRESIAGRSMTAAARSPTGYGLILLKYYYFYETFFLLFFLLSPHKNNY